MVFNHAIDYASLLRGGITLRDSSAAVVPVNFSLSADQKTVGVTPVNNLANGATYTVWINYNTQVLDISGNGQNFSQLKFPFTVEGGTVSAPVSTRTPLRTAPSSVSSH
jgi:hypothetical protein